MKILHVVQAYHPFQEKGGPVFKVRALAETMARHGHDLTVLTANLGIGQFPEIAAQSEKSPWGPRLRSGGVEIIYLPTIAQYRAMTLNPRVLDFCETQLRKFHVIHFFGLYDLLGPAVSYFARRRNIPYVVEPMGMYRPIDRSLRLKAVWHRLLGREFLKSSRRVVVTSEIEQQELLDARFSPETVMIRYNGIDSSLCANVPPRGTFRSKWDLPAHEPLIVFLSRLIPRKGADVLIAAFAQACPQVGWLVIAGPEGETGYCAHLESCAKSCGVRSRVLFPGPIYDQEKKSLYVDADIFALPSRYENFANVAAEAIAFDVPVILGESCGIAALVKRAGAGLIVPPEKSALARAIEKMLADNKLYQELKEGCQRLTGQLDWDTLATEMEDCYGTVLTASGEFT